MFPHILSVSGRGPMPLFLALPHECSVTGCHSECHLVSKMPGRGDMVRVQVEELSFPQFHHTLGSGNSTTEVVLHLGWTLESPGKLHKFGCLCPGNQHSDLIGLRV